MHIQDVYKKYSAKIDRLDLELLIAAAIKKPREFVLTHPEHKLTKNQEHQTRNFVSRRAKHEPLAYILGQKEFYGLNFKVNKCTLIPRPETELLVEKVLKLNPVNKKIIDVGTGCGNIIIALAKNLKHNNNLFAIDASSKPLSVARKNAKFHRVNRKIKFLKGRFLDPLAKKKLTGSLIVANLPYLSHVIYSATTDDIKKYEPRSALLSKDKGLDHYKKLFEQIKESTDFDSKLSVFLELSPEQNTELRKLTHKLFPGAKIVFHKDLAGHWRICQISFI